MVIRPTKPIIRLARTADVPALARLVEQYWGFEGIGGFDVDRVESLLRQALATADRAMCWLAEWEGEVEGYLLAALVFSLEHGGTMAEIDELFVTHAFRKRGIGEALLAQAESTLHAKGVHRLQLQLSPINSRAREFYAARGYGPRSGFALWDKALTGSSACASGIDG